MRNTPTSVLLARGGMHRLAPSDDGASTSSDDITKYNGISDPAGAEELGRRLAHTLRDQAVDAVLVWEDVEDIVLAHVVARELGVSVVRAFDGDGLVRSIGEIAAGSHVVMLTDMFRDAGVVNALRSLVEQRHATVTAVSTLVDSPVVSDRTLTVFLEPGDAVPAHGVS